MLLYKLRALHKFLKEANLVGQEHLDSWAEKIKPMPSGKNRGNNSVRICACEYTAVYILESYSKSPALVMALVTAWLLDNDPTRKTEGLSAPEIEIDIEDETTAEVSIELTFRENVDIVQDDDGDIDYMGKKWRISDADITLVEVGHVYGKGEPHD